MAINGPQNGSFIVAIAGSNGNKATTSGAAFTFSLKGLAAGACRPSNARRVFQLAAMFSLIFHSTASHPDR